MPDKIAYIREAECIGCIKCIKACSDQAILGARKQMHTIITDLCTGCEDCIAVCPVDCIEMIASPSHINPPLEKGGRGDLKIFAPATPTPVFKGGSGDKKDAIAAAIARTLERRGWNKT